jgi:uncharacterized RDD family membrane protein YckC
MNQQYYVAVNGQQTGPFTLEELKAKNIQRATLIWTEGLDSWTKAEQVALVKDIFKIIPPTLPNTESKPIYQQLQPKVSPPPIGKYFGYELARKRDRLFAVIIESIILSIPFLIVFGENYDSDNTYSVEFIFGSTIFSAILGAIFYTYWSGNIGHKIMGLKVISAEDGVDLNKPLQGALREGIKNIFSFAIVPIIWLLWDENKQNLYDKVVKTYVVKKKQVQ